MTIKPILVIATTATLALITNVSRDSKIEHNSIDSLLEKSKTSFAKANNSIVVAEKVQKESLQSLKSKVASLEAEKKMLILKLNKNVENPTPIIDSVEQFNLFPSN